MKTEINRLKMASISLILGLILFVGATFAWFTFSLETSADDLIIEIDGEDFEYRFFLYEEAVHVGNATPTLEGSLCADEFSQTCYWELSNPESMHIISEDHVLVPGNRFSFALEITNISGADLDFSLILGELTSTGFVLPANKIQKAFVYMVTKVVFSVSGIETADVKDTRDILYAGKAPLENPHFGLEEAGDYQLAASLPVAGTGDEQIMIVFFDLYFDPSVSGVDAEGTPTGNSNAFQNQSLMVGKLEISSTID